MFARDGAVRQCGLRAQAVFGAADWPQVALGGPALGVMHDDLIRLAGFGRMANGPQQAARGVVHVAHLRTRGAVAGAVGHFRQPAVGVIPQAMPHRAILPVVPGARAEVIAGQPAGRVVAKASLVVWRRQGWTRLGARFVHRVRAVLGDAAKMLAAVRAAFEAQHGDADARAGFGCIDGPVHAFGAQDRCGARAVGHLDRGQPASDTGAVLAQQRVGVVEPDVGDDGQSFARSERLAKGHGKPGRRGQRGQDQQAQDAISSRHCAATRQDPTARR